MPSMQIKRIAEATYSVRQYDEVMSVGIGEMNEEKLHAHLEAQQLMDYTASEVVDALNVEEEITVRFRAMF
jgi:hypothetical protein